MTSFSHQQIGARSAKGVFFGVPLGELGFCTSLLMALAGGFLAFFFTTFLAIFGK